MKKILFIVLFSFVAIYAKAQFPNTDSLRSYNNRFTTNSAITWFTNQRGNTLLRGIIDHIDSARLGISGSVGVDTLYALNDSTLRYRRNGVFYNVAIEGGGGTNNANLGASYRLLISSSQGIRTIAVNTGTGVIVDSTTTTNALTFRNDTTTVLSTKSFATSIYDSMYLYRKPGTDSVFICVKPYGESEYECTFQYTDTSGGGGELSKSTDSVLQEGVFIFRDSIEWAFKKDTIVAANVTHTRNDFASTVQRSDGVLVTFFSRFGDSPGDFDHARIYATISRDGGRTWEDPYLVVNDGELYDVNPSAAIQPDGDIVLIYLHAIDGTTNDHRRRISTDGGLTFGSSSTIYGGGLGRYYSPRSDVIEKLKNGTWLYVTNRNTTPGDTGSGTGNYKPEVISSTDFGSTWSFLSTAVQWSDSLCVESKMKPVKDGTIYMISRSRAPNQLGAGGYHPVIHVSTDNGASWSAARLSAIETVNSAITIDYDEETDNMLIAHNVPVGGGTGPTIRRVMALSVSPGPHYLQNVKTVWRVDSLSGYHYIEPSLTKYKNEWLLHFSQGNSDESMFDLKMVRVPLYAITGADGGNANTFNNLVVSKGMDGATEGGVVIGVRGVTSYTWHTKFINQTTGPTGYSSAWWLTQSSSQPFLWYNTVPTGTTASIRRHNINGGSALADGTIMEEIQNVGTARFRIYGNGSAEFLGTGYFMMPKGTDGQAPAGVFGMMRSQTDSLRPFFYDGTAWRGLAFTYELGSGGGGGGSFISSAGATTLTGNADITQGGNRFTLDEGLAIGRNVKEDAQYNLELYEGTSGTMNYLRMLTEHATNYNIIRATTKTAAGGYDIISGRRIIVWDLQDGTGFFGSRANSDLPGDNVRNMEMFFRSRVGTTSHDGWTQRADGALRLSKTQITGSGDGSIIKSFSNDLGEANAFMEFYTYASSGPSHYSPGFRTRSHGASGRGYAMNFNFSSTAADEGIRFIVNNDGATITGSNELFNVLNHTTSRFRILGDGTTTMGTITTGVWNGTAIGPTFGGTNQTTWTTGDLLYASGSNTLSKRAIGTPGQVFQVVSGVPQWADNPGYSVAITTTSDNTPTTIATIDATPGENYNVEVIVSGITSTGNAAYSSKKVRQVLLNAGGSFVTGTQTNVLADEYIGNGDLTTATISISTTGTDIILVVTGETGDTITWTVHYRYTRSLVAL